MSVELLDTPRFHGFRVRRQVAGKSFQEYFPLKENGKRIRGARRAEIKAQAEARDEELAQQQLLLREKAVREICIEDDGRVRGIFWRIKREKSGTSTPVFHIGIKSALEGKVVNTTVSIKLHGREGAWLKAIEFYALHKKINKRSKAWKALLDACPSVAKLEEFMPGAIDPRSR